MDESFSTERARAEELVDRQPQNPITWPRIVSRIIASLSVLVALDGLSTAGYLPTAFAASPLDGALHSAAVALALLLGVAGIGVWKMRRWSLRLFTVYFVCSVLFTGIIIARASALADQSIGSVLSANFLTGLAACRGPIACAVQVFIAVFRAAPILVWGGALAWLYKNRWRLS